MMTCLPQTHDGSTMDVEEGRFGGPGQDRTDDLFHAMEARSQLRHRTIFGDTGVRAWNLYHFRRGWVDSQRARSSFAGPHSCGRYRYMNFLATGDLFRIFPQVSSAIIDCAPHLHNFSKTT